MRSSIGMLLLVAGPISESGQTGRLPGLKVIWLAGGNFRVVDRVGSTSELGGFVAETPVSTLQFAALKALLKKEPRCLGVRLRYELGLTPVVLMGPRFLLLAAAEPEPLVAVT